jgi:hypothetical protein
MLGQAIASIESQEDGVNPSVSCLSISSKNAALEFWPRQSEHACIGNQRASPPSKKKPPEGGSLSLLYRYHFGWTELPFSSSSASLNTP